MRSSTPPRCSTTWSRWGPGRSGESGPHRTAAAKPGVDLPGRPHQRPPAGTPVVAYHQRDRCSDIWLSAGSWHELRLSFDFGSVRIRPSRAQLRRYAGRRVLYTLSKDNDPAWVVDWARFHVVNHGADAVLLYDNGSTRYPPGELLRLLRAALPGVRSTWSAWPFRYGPGGFSSASGWDSDFCQAGAFQDARFRFLERARSVLNADVDELVVSASGRSVFEAAERSQVGCVAFAGDWIAAALDGQDQTADSPARRLPVPRERRARRMPAQVVRRARPVPEERDWSTHHVRMPGFTETVTDEFGYRHFRAISTNWKYRRSAPVPGPRAAPVDRPLEAALAPGRAAP